MAFSSSYNYTESYTAASLIARALKRLGIMDASESVVAAEETDALEVLNLIVKEWVTHGVNIWLTADVWMFLHQPDAVGYVSIASTGSRIFKSHETTQLAVAAAATDSTITVDDATLATMINGSYILIELDSGALHRTTINGAPAGSVVTLTTAMPSAAAVDSYVYTAASNTLVDYPIETVKSAVSLQSNSDTLDSAYGGLSAPLRIIGEDEYALLSNKLSEGPPTALMHRRSTNASSFFVWPTGRVENLHRISMVITKRFQDLDATTNNLDVPPEGVNPLCWQLAAELASEYGLSEVEQRRLWSIANRKVDNFFDFQVENADVSFTLDYPQNR